jgi:Protein tyrosine phosphatase-like protein, PTPLA
VVTGILVKIKVKLVFQACKDLILKTENVAMTTPRTLVVKAWLVGTNAAVALAWSNVVLVALLHRQRLLDDESRLCASHLIPATRVALYCSFVELFNALAGFTRSKAPQVLLFGLVRLGVEMLLTPILGCSDRLHLFTVFCWSVGDTVRFACFFFDNLLLASTWPKTIRYSVGPFLFPLGAIGEMLMVIAVALQKNGAVRWAILGAASLWPAGFITLYRQLLRQRRKFFAGKAAGGNIAKDD